MKNLVLGLFGVMFASGALACGEDAATTANDSTSTGTTGAGAAGSGGAGGMTTASGGSGGSSTGTLSTIVGVVDTIVADDADADLAWFTFTLLETPDAAANDPAGYRAHVCVANCTPAADASSFAVGAPVVISGMDHDGDYLDEVTKVASPCWSADVDLNASIDAADATLVSGESGATGFPGFSFADLDRDGDVDGMDEACVNVQIGGVGYREMVLTPPVADVTQLGRAVSLDGDLLVVSSKAKVFAFHFDGSSWQFEQELAPQGAVTAFSNARVDLQGDIAVVGGDGLHAYKREANGSWSAEGYLTSATAPSGSLGNLSVAYDDGVAVANGNLRAVAWQRDGVGNWTEIGEIQSSNASSGQHGRRVAYQDKTLVLNSPQQGPNPGRVHVFELVGGNFVEGDTLLQEDPNLNFYSSAFATDAGRVLSVGSITTNGQIASWGELFSKSGNSYALTTGNIEVTESVHLLSDNLTLGAGNAALGKTLSEHTTSLRGLRLVTGQASFPAAVSRSGNRVAMGLRRVSVDGSGGGIDDRPGAVIVLELED